MYTVSAEDNKSWARVGKLKTAHGVVETPVFMPVATKGTAKLLDQKDLEEIGIECIIANAFLLHLKPGSARVKKAGGLHDFINWRKGIFTDSGGFQILNKEFLVKNSSKGVVFRNPFDGSKMLITPEEAVKIQNDLGSDVAMVLDDVPHYGQAYPPYFQSVKRTKEWAKRCKKAHANDKQLLFGIAQGGVFKDLRAKSIAELKELDFDGLALGGMCIGESKKEMFDIVKFCTPIMPADKPRYLMGVGSPEDLLECIGHGIDVFDSCFPTRMARHAVVFTSQGKINLSQAKYADDFSPLDEECDCRVCRHYTRAYLHHLIRSKEFNGLMHLSYHNIFMIQKLFERAKKAIKRNEFSQFKEDFLKKYNGKSQGAMVESPRTSGIRQEEDL